MTGRWEIKGEELERKGDETGVQGRTDVTDVSRKWQPRTGGHIVSHL